MSESEDGMFMLSDNPLKFGKSKQKEEVKQPAEEAKQPPSKGSDNVRSSNLKSDNDKD